MANARIAIYVESLKNQPKLWTVFLARAMATGAKHGGAPRARINELMIIIVDWAPLCFTVSPTVGANR